MGTNQQNYKANPNEQKLKTEKYKIQHTEEDSFQVLCTPHLNENNKTIIILKDLKDGILCV